MNKRKAILPLLAPLTLGLLASVAACGQSAVQGYTVKLVNSYSASGASVAQGPQLGLLFKNGNDDIPYIAAESFLDPNVTPFTKSSSDGVYTFDSTGRFKLSLDTKNDKVTVSDYVAFVNPETPDNALVANKANFVSTVFPDSKTEKGSSVTFDFGKYGFDVVEYTEGDFSTAFAPLTPLSLALTSGNAILSYNGTSVVAGAGESFIDAGTGKLTSLGEVYYDGEYAKRTAYTQEFAKYNYNCLGFAFDYFCGLAPEKGITDFRSYFEKQGYASKLLSTDPKKVSDAIAEFIYAGMDEHHNNYFVSNYAEKGLMSPLSDGTKTFSELYSGTRRKKMIAYDKAIYEAKKPYVDAQGAYPSYQVKDGVAVIYFPGFVASSYTTGQTVSASDTNTFAIFYNGFKEAAANSSVKKVVINLADNGGGAAMALVQSLGFLGKGGEAHFDDKYKVDGSFSTQVYRVDTNLDGLYDANDGYADKFEQIYVLESYSSFSCANAFPCYAKEYAGAKVIGETSGGGNAVVGNICLPSGDAICCSSNDILGLKKNGTFTSFDAGCTPDYQLTDKDSFFNIDKLAAYVNGLK